MWRYIFKTIKTCIATSKAQSKYQKHDHEWTTWHIISRFHSTHVHWEKSLTFWSRNSIKLDYKEAATGGVLQERVFKSLERFTGKHLWQVLLFNKVFSGTGASFQFCKIFKNILFTKHPRWLLLVLFSLRKNVNISYESFEKKKLGNNGFNSHSYLIFLNIEKIIQMEIFCSLKTWFYTNRNNKYLHSTFEIELFAICYKQKTEIFLITRPPTWWKFLVSTKGQEKKDKSELNL